MAILLVGCGSSICEVTPDETPSFVSVNENPSFDSVGGDGFLGLT